MSATLTLGTGLSNFRTDLTEVQNAIHLQEQSALNAFLDDNTGAVNRGAEVWTVNEASTGQIVASEHNTEDTEDDTFELKIQSTENLTGNLSVGTISPGGFGNVLHALGGNVSSITAFTGGTGTSTGVAGGTQIFSLGLTSSAWTFTTPAAAGGNYVLTLNGSNLPTDVTSVSSILAGGYAGSAITFTGYTLTDNGTTISTLSVPSGPGTLVTTLPNGSTGSALTVDLTGTFSNAFSAGTIDSLFNPNGDGTGLISIPTLIADLVTNVTNIVITDDTTGQAAATLSGISLSPSSGGLSLASLLDGGTINGSGTSANLVLSIDPDGSEKLHTLGLSINTPIASFVGGTGINELDYSAFTTPVTVNLSTGTAPNGLGGTFSITGVNCVEASSFSPAPGTAGSTLTGGSGSVTFFIDGTDDVLIGGSGSMDAVFNGESPGVSITGGTGTNTIDMSSFVDAATVNITAGTITDAIIASTPDHFSNVQVFDGTPGNDTFIAGPGSYTINGGGGTDTVNFSGDYFQYSISSSNGVITLVDNRTGSPNGAATLNLSSGSTLHFANASLPVSLLAPPASSLSVVGDTDDFLRLTGGDLFIRTSTGQLSIDEINNSGTVLGNATLTAGGTPITIDGATTVVGGGEDFAESGDRDVFYRNASGQLFGWQFNASNALVSNLFFTVGGAPLTIDNFTHILGAGEDFLDDGDQDLFYRNSSGQLFGWQFTSSGALVSNLFFTESGAPVAALPGMSIIGAGQDYARSGSRDLFYRNLQGQLFADQFNSSGVLVSTLAFTVGGAPLATDGATMIIGAGEDFANSGDTDLFYENAEGQLLGWQFNGSQALVSNLFFTVGGSALTVSDGTAIIGAGEDYAASGDHDLFYRTPTGQLFGWQFTSAGALASNLFFTVGGAALTVNDGTTIIGAGEDFAGSGDTDLFYDNPSGELFGWQFTASGALAGNLFFNAGGAPLAINDGTTIIGAGEDYSGDGTLDLFYRTAADQLFGWEFNASDTLVTNLFFTVGGGAFTVADGTAIIGAGEDFAGTGDRDLFYQNASSQLFGWQFNASGALASNLFLTVGGAELTINDGTTIIGAGEDYAGTGDRDLFYRNPAGQLFGWQFNASGALISNLFFTVGGAPLPIADGNTIIGAGEDFAGTGDTDLFYQNPEDQLFGWQFNASGALVSNLFFTQGGAPLPVIGGTSIIGAGEDYTGNGDTDLFYRNSLGQLYGWQFNASGVFQSNLIFTVGGNPLPINGGMAIIGAGEDYTGDGNTDLFYRNAAAQLFGWEFNASGALAGNLFYTAGGAPIGISDATTIIGAGEDYTGDGNTDLFYRNAAGQLFGWEFNASGALAGNLFFTQSGAPLAIGSDSEVLGAGHNFLSSGGDDLFVRSSSGTLSVLEFNGSGSQTGGEAFAALGNGDSAQVRVGTIGSDTLTGPAGASTLIGDGGTDTYVFAAGDTNELIINGVFGAATSGTLSFTTSVTDDNLWLDRVDDNGNVSSSGNNLRIDVMGTTTGVVIDDWFAAGTPNGPLSSITAGGLTLDTQVSNLVSAMATFETDNPSFNPTSPANPTITDSTVLSAVNADWHH